MLRRDGGLTAKRRELERRNAIRRGVGSSPRTFYNLLPHCRDCVGYHAHWTMADEGVILVRALVRGLSAGRTT